VERTASVHVNESQPTDRYDPELSEGEDVYDVRPSLENDLEMYASLAETFREQSNSPKAPGISRPHSSSENS
jgi:hypothetical protein